MSLSPSVRSRLDSTPISSAAIALATTALLVSSVAQAQPNDPIAVATKYFETRGSQCAELWSMYSKATQDRIRAAANRRERDRAGLPRPFDPAQEGCVVLVVDKPKKATARIVRQQGDEAVVAAEIVTHPSRFRYDVFPPAKVVTEELSLVREEGAWRVVLPVAARTERGIDWTPQEFGPVDVMMPVQITPGLINRFEATAVLRTNRGALETILRDPQRWVSALPGVKAVQPASASDGPSRLLMQFEEPGRTLPVRVRPGPASSGDPNVDSTVAWNAEETPASPVHFRGSWTVKSHADGSSRVTLVFHLDVKQWPGDYALRNFSAERVAQAVLDLEKAAR